MSRLANRLQFKKGDPLRDLHVPKRQRTDIDPELDEPDVELDDVDRDAIRANDRVVPPEDLQ